MLPNQLYSSEYETNQLKELSLDLKLMITIFLFFVFFFLLSILVIYCHIILKLIVLAVQVRGPSGNLRIASAGNTALKNWGKPVLANGTERLQCGCCQHLKSFIIK